MEEGSRELHQVESVCKGKTWYCNIITYEHVFPTVLNIRTHIIPFEDEEDCLYIDTEQFWRARKCDRELYKMFTTMCQVHNKKKF